MLRLICPSHHFKSHHQVLITVKCSASGMCLGHKSSDIHHRNHKCKLIYTSTTISNLHKKDCLYCLYMYIKYTARKTSLSIKQKKRVFFKIQKITFIWYLLQTIDVFCQCIAECPSKYFFLYSIVFVLWISISGAGLFNIPRISWKKNKITLKQLKNFN